MISYIGLGSNLGDSREQLNSAITAMNNDNCLQVLQVSSYYQSKALTLPGTESQNDYINAVLKLKTLLSAQQLLIKLHEIEAQHGRERKEKWGSRTLDLDILLYDDQIIKSEKLIIPHSQIALRNFVIHPLFEIAGDLKIPGIGHLAELANRTAWDGMEKAELLSNKN